MNLSSHQIKQIEVINSIENQLKNKSFGFTTVAPVNDFANDTRICLTSVHLPHQELINKIQNELIQPLQKIEPSFFFYPPDSIHTTIKNIRVINDPPHFDKKVIEKAAQVFESTVSDHKKFKKYFYRLLLFPNNLALVGTTDTEFDDLVLDLDKKLKENNIPDDKIYANPNYFFSNITLARFNKSPSNDFIDKVKELSESIKFEPYLVDSVTLITCTAIFAKKNIIDTWYLK